MSTEEIRKEAVATYNDAFDLIESGADVLKAVDLASKSLELWRQVGNDQNMAIGYWAQSRAYVAAHDSRADEAIKKTAQLVANIADIEDRELIQAQFSSISN